MITLAYHQPICFGGSGGAFGTAEKEGSKYKINGCWHYATGAPYLSHFTINAKLLENGKQLLNEDGSPMIRSFILPHQAVHIVEDWNTMALLATATHSFDVREEWIEEKTAAASTFTDEYVQSIHAKAVDSVQKLTAAIVEVYPLLGIKASREDQQLNQIFRDYFTATQHHNFVDR